GISNPYLSQIERGLRAPSEQVLEAIAKNLKLSADARDLRGVRRRLSPWVVGASSLATAAERQGFFEADALKPKSTGPAGALHGPLGDGAYLRRLRAVVA